MIIESTLALLSEPIDEYMLAHLKLEQLRRKGIVNYLPKEHVAQLQETKTAATERMFEIINNPTPTHEP